MSLFKSLIGMALDIAQGRTWDFTDAEFTGVCKDINNNLYLLQINYHKSHYKSLLSPLPFSSNFLLYISNSSSSSSLLSE